MTLDITLSGSALSDPRGPGSSEFKRAEAVRVARGHSSLIRRLRFGVPGAALVLALGFAGWVYADRPDPIQAPDLASLGLTGASITMEKPKLSGFNSENRAYQVTADSAAQQISEPHKVDLSKLTAQIQFGKDGWARLAASLGKLDAEKQSLDLERSVTVTTDAGDTAQLSRAQVGLKDGAIKSDAPVNVTAGTTLLTADGMEIGDNGDKIIFRGHVSVTLFPESRKQPANDQRQEIQP